MARPKKIGLDYFPLNCQMNDKVVLLEKALGLVGFAVYIKLLQRIYKTEDGMLDMSDRKQNNLFARALFLTLEQFLSIIDTLCDLDLFDEKAYQERKVLTSEGVRKRLSQVDSLRRRKRDKTEINQGKPDKTELSPSETELSPSISTQREREIEKESYLENNTTTSTTNGDEIKKKYKRFCIADQPEFTPPTLEEVQQYFTENECGNAEAEAANFHLKYSAFEWIRNDGFFMFNWKSSALAWIQNIRERTQRNQMKAQTEVRRHMPTSITPTSQFDKRESQYRALTREDDYDSLGNRISA